MPLGDFVEYVRGGAAGDVNPRYVFEPKLRAPLTQEYDRTVGGLFESDHLGVLGDVTRPSYRWLCLGPRRSGSSPHIDPLGTSAWNALISGRKRWVLVDPGTLGARLLKSELSACGLSPVEWFRDRLPSLRSKCPEAVHETILEAGEIMYVPAGTWHAVLNLTDTVAITHNYVGAAEFDGAWRAVRAERPGLAQEWYRLLLRHHPALAERAAELNRADGAAPCSSLPARPAGKERGPEAQRHRAGLATELLRQRLAGGRRLEPPCGEALAWASAAVLGSHQRWQAARSFAAGELVFVSKALACVYDDEAEPGRVPAKLVQAVPRTEEVQGLLGGWGVGPAASAQDVYACFLKAAQSVWCLPGRRGSTGGPAGPPGSSSHFDDRVDGLALFQHSGRLRHSHQPALALTFVADVCVATAVRDVAVGSELTVCLAPWRFDEAACSQDLKASKLACQDGHDDCPRGLPPRDSTQFNVIRHIFAEGERALWSGDDHARQVAAAKLRCCMSDLGEAQMLRSFWYLRLRAQVLVAQLNMFLYRLDDAWDAVFPVLELVYQAPLHEGAELCTSLALLGTGLAAQQKQADRARELFAAGHALLAKTLGGDRGAWEDWMRTFVPSELVQCAVDTWNGAWEGEAPGPAGLGSFEGDVPASADDEGTNMERWDAQSLATSHEGTAGDVKGSLATESVGTLVPPTPLGDEEVEVRGSTVVVSLRLAEGLGPEDVSVDVGRDSVLFALLGGSPAGGLAWSLTVPLPAPVDAHAAAPARFSRRKRRLELVLPLADRGSS